MSPHLNNDLEVEKKIEFILQEARKLAISRPVEMDKLEEGVHQSINTVNVSVLYHNLSHYIATAKILPSFIHVQ